MTSLKSFRATKYREIDFQNEHEFAESFYIENDDIYIPANINHNNIIKCSLYKYNLTKFTEAPVVMATFLNTIILGCEIKNKIFYGCITNTNCLLIYNLEHKQTIRRLKLKGCPNDICVHDKKIYLGINYNYRIYNGAVICIDTVTYAKTTIKSNLYAVCGIYVDDKNIYVTTLVNVMIIDKVSSHRYSVSVSNPLNPMYDNVRMHDDHTIDVAIYNYDNRVQSCVLRNYCLLAMGQYLFSTFFGSGYYDYVNPSSQRNANLSKQILFANINHQIKETTYYKMSNDIPDFDYEITQISYIQSLDKYVMTNWKANKFIIIDKYFIEDP